MASSQNGNTDNKAKTLQELLSQLGYGTSTDIVSDDMTLKNASSTSGTGQTATAAQATAGGGNVPGFTTPQPTYTSSQELLNAGTALTQHQQNQPGEYQSAYAGQIDALLNDLLSRPDFNYDVSTDPLYAQYAEQYQRMGQKAMQDTMGQAASLTGGYGNSYAHMAGQQTYQGYLEQLNNVVPELYDAAYNRYRVQGDDMRQNLGMLQGIDNSQYGRHRDNVGDYYTDLNYLTGQYNTQYEQEYGRYQDAYAQWQNAQAFAYQQELDRIAQSNWQQEYNLAVSQANKKPSSSGSGSRRPTTASVPTSYKEFVALTGQSGIMTESEFTRNKRRGAGNTSSYATYQDYLNSMWAKYN